MLLWDWAGERKRKLLRVTWEDKSGAWKRSGAGARTSDRVSVVRSPHLPHNLPSHLLPGNGRRGGHQGVLTGHRRDITAHEHAANKRAHNKPAPAQSRLRAPRATGSAKRTCTREESCLVGDVARVQQEARKGVQGIPSPPARAGLSRLPRSGRYGLPRGGTPCCGSRRRTRAQIPDSILTRKRIPSRKHACTRTHALARPHTHTHTHTHTRVGQRVVVVVFVLVGFVLCC